MQGSTENRGRAVSRALHAHDSADLLLLTLCYSISEVRFFYLLLRSEVSFFYLLLRSEVRIFYFLSRSEVKCFLFLVTIGNQVLYVLLGRGLSGSKHSHAMLKLAMTACAVSTL